MHGKEILKKILDEADLSGRILCLHSSFSSIKPMVSDPDILIDIFLDRECTLIVPVHDYTMRADVSSPGIFIHQNGMDRLSAGEEEQPEKRFKPEFRTVSKEMGIIPQKIFRRKDTFRGNHPENALAGIGPEASRILHVQTPWDVYAPYDMLYRMKNVRIVLIGVGLRKATPVHYAEMRAGRQPFIRWYRDAAGVIRPMRIGGCSDGFEKLGSCVNSIENQVHAGPSVWRIFPFRPFINRISEEIQKNPQITHCDKRECPRCCDSIKGGPFFHFQELRAKVMGKSCPV